jgi:hypothetical protein
VAEAAGAYRAALQIDASEPQAHAGLGHCAFVRGQHREAFDHFVRAAALWREREDTIAALGCYTHAVASDPSQLDIHVEIAELEVELGNTDAARQRLEGLAENYLASGRADDAVAILEFVNGWDDAPAPAAAPEIIAAPAGIPDYAPEPVRDVEGTMVISTFLLTPEGKPFVAAAAARAPEPAPEPEVDVDVDLEPSRLSASGDTAPEPASIPIEIDDDIEATATRQTPLPTAPDEDSLVSASELDGIELPPDLFGGEAVEERDATTVRPIPVAAMPPKQQPAPPSRDAQGRTLAERLRSTRARAATAPHPTTKPTLAALAAAAAARSSNRGASPRPAPQPAASTPRAPSPTAKPTAAPPGKPTAVGKPPAAGRVASPQPAATAPRTAATPSPAASRTAATPSATATRPTAAPQRAAAPSTATPRAAASKPAAAPTRTGPAPRAGKHATPAAKPPARGAAPSNGAPTKPAATARPTAAARPTATARTTAAARPTAAPKTEPAGRTEPRRGTEASKRPAAARSRTPAPGVPTPVGPSRTLPLVIPPPPKPEELDDSRTVLYRGSE